MTDNLQNTNKNKIKDVDDVFSQIHQQFKSDIYNYLDIFFDSLKGVLFVFEQNSKADYKESINYKAIKAVINKNKTIKKEIINSISSAFKYFKQGNYNFFINENLPVSNYQKPLLNDNNTDEMSIIHELISKTENANEKELHILANLFSEMAFDKTLTFNQLPVSPFVLVNSLVNSIKDMDLNSGIRMIIYNSFDVNVLLKTNLIYCQLVIKNSINSKDKEKSKKQDTADNVIDSTYKIIATLLNRYHKLKDGKKNDSKFINKNLIIQSMNIVQEKIIKKNELDAGFVPNSKEIKELLVQAVVKLDKNSKGLDFSPGDLDAIILVSLFFQYIKNDKSIPHQLKVLIIRLELPVLKIAFRDVGIFKNKANPIRLLINQMSYVPDGFSDNLNSSNKYIMKLEEIVAVMLIQTSYTLTLYENLNEELNKFTSKMNNKFNIIQKRIKEKAVGLDKIAQVRKTVTDILEKKMHDRHMPIYIKDLLLKIWFNVMVIEFLRHPPESQACKSKLKFVEMLLDAAKPNINISIDIKYISCISTLFKDGLSLVAFNSKELENKNNELVDFLTNIHGLVGDKEKLGTQGNESQNSEMVLFVKNSEASVKSSTQEHQIPDNYDIKAKKLKVGTWLEFKRKKSKPFRAKISWVSPITGNYLFVNSNGVRLGDKSPAEIAGVFRDKTCNELQTVPLFDRALLQIAKQLNQKMRPKSKKK